MISEKQPPLLIAHSLEKCFNGTTAVRNINLELFSGELLAILGPSGCGKSTLLRLIAGLSVPDTGEILYGGQHWANGQTFVPPEARDCGMVFQDMALFPHLSIGDNIGFAIDRQHKKTVVNTMLTLVDLEGMAQRMVHQLSGGQQQRAALARSLAAGPGLLLLDEPFSSLDLKLRQTMRREVRKILKQQGVTAILVTHDQNEAFAFADKVAVMFDGSIEQQASPHDIYHQPATTRTAAFVGDANFLTMAEAQESFALPENLASVLNKKENILMIRPEDFLLKRGKIESATIIDTEFQGAWQQLLIKLDSGLRLNVYADTVNAWQKKERLTLSPRRGCIYSSQEKFLDELRL